MIQFEQQFSSYKSCVYIAVRKRILDLFIGSHKATRQILITEDLILNIGVCADLYPSDILGCVLLKGNMSVKKVSRVNYN